MENLGQYFISDKQALTVVPLQSRNGQPRTSKGQYAALRNALLTALSKVRLPEQRSRVIFENLHSVPLQVHDFRRVRGLNRLGNAAIVRPMQPAALSANQNQGRAGRVQADR